MVFVDGSGRLNLFGGVPLSSYEELRREAALAVSYLDDGLSDGFDVLFMAPVEFLRKCDHYVQYVLFSFSRFLACQSRRTCWCAVSAGPAGDFL